MVQAKNTDPSFGAVSIGVLENWKKVTAPSANEPDMFHEANANRSTDARVKRAPRGLTREVLARVFAENPKGLTMEATQDAAVALDERISRKTVYNEMYRETDTAASTGVPNTTQSWPGFISGEVQMGGSPSGAVQVTLASETAGTNVTMKAGSFLRYREIA